VARRDQHRYEQGGHLLMIGTGLGLGIAALATDDWDVPDTRR
jgi:hypothetical protein